MANKLGKITIQGFKSINELIDFEIKPINVLIGGNGAGKSNLIDFFRMVRAMLHLPIPELSTSNLDMFFNMYGGFDNFLFKGQSSANYIVSKMEFGENSYAFRLDYTADESYIIANEIAWYNDFKYLYGSGLKEPNLLNKRYECGVMSRKGVGHHIYESINSWCIYHFHNSSKETAKMRQSAIVEDTKYLRFDASNIAPFLLNIKNDHKDIYKKIINTVQIIAPFFDDFLLTVNTYGNGKKDVKLDWKQKFSDFPMQPYHLSDGTIRFICLATALMQPSPPSVIFIDEPELGLHPEAIEILGELVNYSSQKSNIIITTQSTTLVDQFAPEDIVTVDNVEGESIFNRLNKDELSGWLEDYSTSELWQKNIISGNPLK